MDTYEILSTIRSFSGLPTENEIGTPLLKRYLNKGKDKVVDRLSPLFKDSLVITREYSSQSGATLDLPADVMRLLGVQRKDANAVYRDCAPVDTDNKEAIDSNVNLTAMEKYPLYVREQNTVTIYPILASTDVKLRYRQRTCDLMFDLGTYLAGTTITLNSEAVTIDDYYNNYELAIYQKLGADMILVGTYPISDYVASTKVATLTGATLTSLVYFYALVPIIPSEYHDLIVDAGLIELKKGKEYEDGTTWRDDDADLRDAINIVLQTNIGGWPAHGQKEKS